MSDQSNKDKLKIGFPPLLVNNLVDEENGLPIQFSSKGRIPTIKAELPTQVPLGKE